MNNFQLRSKIKTCAYMSFHPNITLRGKYLIDDNHNFLKRIVDPKLDF